MKQFVPVEPSINAAIIVALASVTTTTATLDDDTVVTVPNTAIAGDFVIGNADGSFTYKTAEDFDAHFKPA
jgi:hypothetical protein